MLTPSDIRTAPPGDWKYREESTGVTFKHHDLTTLMSQIKTHRQSVGLPTHGDWIEQVYAKICEQNPQVRCHEKGVPDRVWLAEDILRFLSTLKEFVTGSDSMVTEEEQLRRLNICKGCPKNGYIVCRGCGAIGELTATLFSGRKMPKVEEVQGRSCTACGCGLIPKAAFPVAALRAVDAKLGTSPDYDARCWMLEPQANPALAAA